MNNTKKRRELTEKERYVIEKCLKEKCSKSFIASLLSVSVKTIHREIIRGTVELKDYELRLYSRYSASYAEGRHMEAVGRRGRKPSYIKHWKLIVHIRSKLVP